MKKIFINLLLIIAVFFTFIPIMKAEELINNDIVETIEDVNNNIDLTNELEDNNKNEDDVTDNSNEMEGDKIDDTAEEIVDTSSNENNNDNNALESIEQLQEENIVNEEPSNNYKVIFTHKGYQFSIPGGSNILLSKLNQKLGINISLSDVYEIFSSNNNIINITRVNNSNDWSIKSLKSFTTEETIIIHTFSGDEYIIKVTDPEDEKPLHNKDLISNNNGTYTISLDVTGDSDPEIDTAANVNIVIVYDISQSMSENAGTSRYSRGDQAEDVVHDFIQNIASYQDKTNPSNIEMALVTFSVTGSTVSEWTTNLNSILSNFDDGGTDGQTHFRYNGMGTNWQSALSLAEGLVNSADGDQTFVILVTDGAPTASGNGSNAVSPNSSLSTLTRFYNAALPYAKSIQGNSKTTFYGIYIYGDDADLLDDLMYNSFRNDGEERTVGEGTVSAPNYYNASETSFLQIAIDEILGQVIQAMGISSVYVSDGTTSSVKATSGTVHLLDVDESSYKYWLSMDVTAVPGQTDTYINNTTGNTITFTKSGNNYIGIWTNKNGSHSITGKIETIIDPDDNTKTKTIFKMEWTASGNDLHNEAPTPAELLTDEDGNESVDWDLSSHGVLLNGVTYTVTFRVWPSQYTLDLIADLKNHPEKYDSLGGDIKTYLLREGTGENASYILKTNTHANITFVDTRPDGTQNGNVDYENPDPISTMSTQTLAVTKDWVNELDQRTNSPVTLNVLQDTRVFNSIELNEGNSFKGSSYISVGIMTIDEDGNVDVLTTGHDYTFGELGSDVHNWELKSDIVHPMLINGELTLLYKRGTTVPTNGTYYKLGDYYYVVGTLEEGVAKLTATNERRSYIDFEKDVTYDEGFATFDDQLFEFNISVIDRNEEDIWFSIKESKDSNARFITTDDGLVVTGATPELNDDGIATNYYFAPSGSTFTVKIKKGWNLRITNLLSGAIYSFEEVNIDPKFKLDKTEVKIKRGEEETTETGTSTTVSGTVEYANSSYSIKFINKNISTDITVDKTWLGDDTSSRPSSITVQLQANDVNYGEAKEMTPDKDGNWSYTFKTLPLFDDNGQITYSIKEVTVPGYISEVSGNQVDGFQIVNIKTTSVTVTKIWTDNGNVDNNRPRTITIQLQANGSNYGEAYTLSGTGDTWSHEFTDLPTHINGNAVTYTAVETEVPTGYAESYSTDHLTITNTLGTTSVTVTKIWDDNNKEMKRPDSVIIHLLIDNDKVDSVELSEANKWTYTFTELAKYVNGSEAEYSVIEEAVENYLFDITGSQEEGFIVTNSYDNFGEGDEIEEPPYTGLDDSVDYSSIFMIIVSAMLLVVDLRKKYLLGK